MCDLLPCPHQRKYAEDYGKSKKGSDYRHYGKDKTEFEKNDSENTEKIDEIDKISNYRYLRAERPDVEVISSGSEERVPIRGDNSEELLKQESRNDQSRSQGKRSKVTELESLNVTEPSHSRSNSRNRLGKRYEDSEKESYKYTTTSASETDNRYLRRQESNKRKHQQKTEVVDDSLNEQNSLFDQSLNDMTEIKGGNQRMPRPRQSASPVRGKSHNVESAIGQVGHYFAYVRGNFYITRKLSRTIKLN